MTSRRNESFEEEEARELAEIEEERARDAKHREFMLNMRTVLETEAGRHVLWTIVAKCGTFEPIFDPSARMAANAGRQEVGQDLMRLIGEADEHLLLRMLSQEYSRKLKESLA